MKYKNGKKSELLYSWLFFLWYIPWFTGQTTIRISGTTEQKPGHSFPEIMCAFRDSRTNASGKGLCPECGTHLISSQYEGVHIKSCSITSILSKSPSAGYANGYGSKGTNWKSCKSLLKKRGIDNRTDRTRFGGRIKN